MALTKEETIELLATIKLEAGHYAKLPIDNDKLERAIEAAEGGDLKPAIMLGDQVAGEIWRHKMEDQHKELYVRCVALANAS